MDQIHQKQLLTDCLLCFVFALLIVFGNKIDMLTGGINYILSSVFMFVFTILVLVRFIKRLIAWFKKRTSFNFFSVGVYLIALFLACWGPDTEVLEAKPIITAYYDGTQNQAFLTFRANKQFQLNWSGVFGYNKWFVGKYEKKSDTLFLTYRGEKPVRFGTKILISKGELLSLDKPMDSTSYFCPFKIR